MFEIPPSAPCDWRAVLHRPAAQSGRGGLLVPVENNCWQVNLTGMHGQLVPESVENLSLLPRHCEPRPSMTRSRMLYLLDLFTGSAFPAVYGDTLRGLDSFPDRLLPLGDVICRFNPAFGQGMSVAAQEVGVLKRLIEARAPMLIRSRDWRSPSSRRFRTFSRAMGGDRKRLHLREDARATSE
jgi:hypothetical protein